MRDAVHSGTKTEGSMTVEEMRQVLDLTTNYEHNQNMVFCQNTILDTLNISMPTVDENGNVSEADVVSTYDAFETKLQQRMESVNDGKDIARFFSIIMPQTKTKNNGIEIVFTRGQESEIPIDSLRSPSVNGPYEDLCLRWGLDEGLCNTSFPFNIQWDAADELSTCFVSNLTPPGPNYTLVTQNMETITFIATNEVYGSNWVYWTPPTVVTPCENWLYFQYGVLNDEPCLCEDELNCEWSNITNNVVLETGPKHYSPAYHSPYFYCTIHDEYRLCDEGCRSVCYRFHTLEVVYANYYWVPVD